MLGLVLAEQKLSAWRNQAFGKPLIAIISKAASDCQPSLPFMDHQAPLAFTFSDESPSKSAPVKLLAEPMASLLRPFADGRLEGNLDPRQGVWDAHGNLCDHQR